MFSVFIVDDEEIIREGLRNCLEQEESQCVVCGEAADGELALSMIQELQPDILITDICMPFMDGLELIRLVHHSLPHTKIVIISGYDEFEYARKAISLGVSEYVLKPLRASSFLQVIHRITNQIQQEHLSLRETHQKVSENVDLSNQCLLDLLSGEKTTAEILAGTQALNVALPAGAYLTLFLTHENFSQGTAGICALLDSILKQRNDILWAVKDSAAVILICGTPQTLTDEAYAVAQMLQHEFSAVLDLRVTIGIGPIVTHLRSVVDSYQKARSASSELGALSRGHIIGFEDFYAKKNLSISETTLADCLKYAQLEDVDRLVDEYFTSVNANDKQSLLYRYYLTVEMVITCLRLFQQANMEPPAILIQAQNIENLMKLIPFLNQVEDFAKKLLTEVITALRSTNVSHYKSEIDTAKKYISEHYSDSDMSLRTIAAKVGFSPNHFSTVFSQEIGCTFIEYLTRYRIEKAKGLLCDSDLKLTQIAYEIGYNEPNYFSHIFKTHVGVTPREYRAQKKG